MNRKELHQLMLDHHWHLSNDSLQDGWLAFAPTYGPDEPTSISDLADLLQLTDIPRFIPPWQSDDNIYIQPTS